MNCKYVDPQVNIKQMMHSFTRTTDLELDDFYFKCFGKHYNFTHQSRQKKRTEQRLDLVTQIVRRARSLGFRKELTRKAIMKFFTKLYAKPIAQQNQENIPPEITEPKIVEIEKPRRVKMLRLFAKSDEYDASYTYGEYEEEEENDDNNQTGENDDSDVNHLIVEFGKIRV